MMFPWLGIMKAIEHILCDLGHGMLMVLLGSLSGHS